MTAVTIIILVLIAYLYGRAQGIKAQKGKGSEYVIEIRKK